MPRGTTVFNIYCEKSGLGTSKQPDLNSNDYRLMDPLFIATKVFREVLTQYFAKRLKREDLPLITALGVAYWTTYSTGLYVIRSLRRYQDAAAALGNAAPLANPLKWLVGALLSVVLVAAFAIMQVPGDGTKRSITTEMTLLPPALLMSFLSLGAMEIIHKTGSSEYVAVWLLFSGLNALWVSVLLRRYRA